jgi:hypothetical protein
MGATGISEFSGIRLFFEEFVMGGVDGDTLPSLGK